MELRVDIKQEFEQNGFLILQEAFADREIARLSDEVDEIVQGRAAYLPAQEIIYEPETDPPRVRNAFRMHLNNNVFLEAAKHPPLIAVVQEILGNRIRLYGSQVFAKPAQVGTQVPRHQDMPYWPFEPFELVSAWIALDDSNVENGCVRYVAGSHKLGMLPHVPSGVAGNSLGLVDDPRIAALPEHPVEVRRGSCILHHCLTVHRSEANKSPTPRRGLIFVYMSDRVRLTDPSRLKGPANFPVVAE